MKLTLQNQLPQYLNVRLLQNKETGVWVAEIRNLEAFTEADNYLELIYNVNDLVYTYFDIPKEDQHKVWYMPARDHEELRQQKHSEELDKLLRFNILLSPEMNGEYFHR